VIGWLSYLPYSADASKGQSDTRKGGQISKVYGYKNWTSETFYTGLLLLLLLTSHHHLYRPKCFFAL